MSSSRSGSLRWERAWWTSEDHESGGRAACCALFSFGTGARYGARGRKLGRWYARRFPQLKVNLYANPAMMVV
eukprot:3714496-Prymnesium_polylepis.1